MEVRKPLVIGCLLLLVVVNAAFALPCNQAEGFMASYDGKSAIVVRENMANLHALHPNGTVNQIASIGMKWAGMQEFTRNDNGKCGEPDQYPTPSPNFGITVHRTVDFNDMECNMEESEEVVDEEFAIHTLTLTATHPSYPDLLLTSNISTTSATRNVTVYEPTERTIEYIAGTFKMSFQIDNWPWAHTETNMSYLVAAFNASFTVPYSFRATSRTEGEDIVMDVNTADGLIKMRQVFDGAFFLDQTRMVHKQPKPEFSQDYTFGLTAFSRIFSWAFCEFAPPNIKYDKAYYDPSLSILITPAPTPAEPNTPLSKSNKGVLIASIVTPIACVVVIGAIIAYFLLKPEQNPFKTQKRATNPTQHSTIAPSQPAQATSPTKPVAHEKPANGWARSERPQDPI